MTTNQRKLLQTTGIMGVLLTFVVVCLDQAGALVALERLLDKQRALHCQYYLPDPTDKIVHIDIDDAACAAIGKWPWPRSTFSRILDELRGAQSRVIAFDMLFPDDTASTSHLTAAEGSFVSGDDKLFADSLKACPTVLLPVSFSFSSSVGNDRVHDGMVAILRTDLEVKPEEMPARMDRAGFKGLPADTIRSEFVMAREEAMMARLLDPQIDSMKFAEVRSALLPKSSLLSNSPALRLLRKQYDQAESIRILQSKGRKPAVNLPPMLTANDVQAPIPQLERNARLTGFVDYLPFDDGVVAAQFHYGCNSGGSFSQIGFALACAMLNVDVNNPNQISMAERQVTIRPPDADPIAIPTNPIESKFGSISMMDIPWAGRNGWMSLYGLNPDGTPRRHLSANLIWEICERRDSITNNNLHADDPIKLLMGADAQALERYKKNPPAPDDFETRRKLIERLMSDAQNDVDDYRTYTPDKMKSFPPEDRNTIIKTLSAYDALAELRQQTSQLVQELAKYRAELRRELAGRAVLIGWTATGALDHIPTSIDPRCPGVVVHSEVFNAILTRRLLSRAPPWVTICITVLLGLLTGAAVTFFTPWTALASTVAIAGTYSVINGIVLYDKHRLIVGLASPITVSAVVWSGSTLFRYILERAEKAHITKKFRSYVDPSLVNYVIEHPDSARLDGERKEVTIVFTDLKGFTTLTEKMGEAAVTVLSEYMGEMVPIIRRSHGYVNKFLGDGIMCLFGAPLPNDAHAMDALDAVMGMNRGLDAFNERLEQRDLPTLKMRAGINTGVVIVGNTGPPEGTDYTALGDPVNLAARLESANKAVDCHILIGARTAELLNDRYLLRPIGRLRVVGKTESVMTYEPVALKADATPTQKVDVEETSRVVECFQLARFYDCLQSIARAEERLGRSDRLFKLYRILSERYQHDCPDDFVGQIVLDEK